MGAVNFSLDVQLVASLKKVLPLSVFFETGTFKGDTVDAMLPYFDRLITAELSEPLWKEVVDRFAGEKKVELYLGNSPDVIAKFRSELADSSVLYWLDAHWCVADDTSGELSQCPLLEEIRAIEQLNETSLIIIDDARLFLASPPEPHEISQWPSIDSIITALRQISAQHELTVINDVIIYYPRSIRNSVIDYARTHGVDWLRAHQSYLENIDFRCALEEKQAELESMYSNSRQLQSQLQEKEAYLQEQHAAIMSLHAQLQAKQEELEVTYSSGLDLQKQCQQKEAVIQELNRALETCRSSLLNLDKGHVQ